MTIKKGQNNDQTMFKARVINKTLIQDNKINKDATDRTIKLPLGPVYQSFIFKRKKRREREKLTECHVKAGFKADKYRQLKQ